MPDTLENWTMIFDFIHERVKVKPQYVSAIYLVILLEISEFLFKELKEPVKGYTLLEETLVQFHRAKEEEDQREEEEKKRRRRQSGVKKIDREAGDTEEDEMIKKKQKSRTLKVVIRFLQRRLLMWNKELNAGKTSGETKLKIESTALKEKEKYAVVDGDGSKDDDDSDAEEDEKKGDPFCKGWVPSPKATLDIDRLDVFLAGDYEFPSFAAGDPLGIFFKLRYGTRLADQKNHEKALEVLEKAFSLAADVAEEQKRENDAAMEEEKKAKAKQPKAKPQKKKSLTGKELIPHDPRQDLHDVVEMCKRKLYLWRLEYHK